MFQTISTDVKGGGSFKGRTCFSWLPSLYPSLLYLALSHLKPLNQDTETQSVLGLHRIYLVVKNSPGARQRSTTDLDFVMGFRDPPRRFPLPTPMHEERWGAYRLDAIYATGLPGLADVFEKVNRRANIGRHRDNPTNRSLAIQTLEINSTV